MSGHPTKFDKSLRIRQFTRDVCDVPQSLEKR